MAGAGTPGVLKEIVELIIRQIEVEKKKKQREENK